MRRSNNPESIRLYNLEVERTNLMKQLKYEKNEDHKNNLEAELSRVEDEINMIYEAQEEDEIDRIYVEREGVAHMEWLLSEFGEDVFPDRD
ncbi:hypothetical protein QUB56_07255 [Microcoleus sp. AR_TQ3_B6]|uniref:hypothetical protein n=1 Tax=Microcoleus sp. AR_TQ3_B6 TaxID=3055284 RepID=UPI002FD22C46